MVITIWISHSTISVRCWLLVSLEEIWGSKTTLVCVPKCHFSLSNFRLCFGWHVCVILAPSWHPKWSPWSQRRAQNDPNMQPNGTSGRSERRLGEPLRPKDVSMSIWVPFWCLTWPENLQNKLQQDTQMTNMRFQSWYDFIIFFFEQLFWVNVLVQTTFH